jgi:hypothetical protein
MADPDLERLLTDDGLTEDERIAQKRDAERRRRTVTIAALAVAGWLLVPLFAWYLGLIVGFFIHGLQTIT